MKKIRFFLCSFAFFLLLTFLLFVLLVNFCGRGVTDQPWILDLYPLKQHMAANQQSPKILIFGGSSSFFGISGKSLHEYTGMDVINFSLSILTPMRFYLTDLKKHLKSGDIVILAMEVTSHYEETAEKNFSSGLSYLFGCLPETQCELTFPELSTLYFQYGFSWFCSSLFHPDGPLMRFVRGDYDKRELFGGMYKESYVASRWTQSQGQKGQFNWYTGLSVYGDCLVDRKATGTTRLATPLPSVLSEEFLYCYNRIRELTEKRGATLLLVWPNNYFYAEQTGFTEFKKLLADHGIPIYGRPEAMAYPKYFYYEPTHHMNIHGAELWTWELAKIIAKETGRPLKKRNSAWPYVFFADAPARYFSGVKNARIYDTGVRIDQREFSMQLEIPEKLRKKALTLDLIVLPKQKKSPVFTGIRIAGHFCPIQETQYGERMEASLSLSAEFTDQAVMTLDCTINGDEIGMERLCIRQFSEGSVASRQSDFNPPETQGTTTSQGSTK